jgi:AraC-like DNA-binding protein
MRSAHARPTIIMSTATGYTRARSMGRIAEAVRRAGGSVERVFRRAELPLRLIECPDQVILLKDQLALVEHAAQEIGDDALAPRLSLQAGFRNLGPLGAHIGGAAHLEQAIHRCNAGVQALLQSATHMRLEPRGQALVAWSYGIVDPARVGRRRNEVLALGYMTDMLRHFAGRSAAALRVELPGPVPAHGQVEELLGCEIAAGARAAVVFPAEWLARSAPARPAQPVAAPDAEVPSADDLLAGVTQLMRLALLDQRPTVAWMSRRLGLAPRTLQRRRALAGGSFEALRDRALQQRAAELLRASRLSITEIALELGYAEPAHFSRAAQRWQGRTPRSWRHQLQAAARPLELAA